MILHVPHASRRIPEDARSRIVLDDAALEAELDAITDADTDRLAHAAAELAGTRPWIFENAYSRLLVDPERFTGPEEEMLKVGMGPVYVGTTQLTMLRPEDPDDDERLIESYYRPYARSMQDLASERLDATGRVTIIDIHSYPVESLPYELHPDDARPSLCVGTDSFHTPLQLIEAARSAWPGSTELDQPFRGCYVPLRFFKSDRRVQAFMLEIRRDEIESWVSGNEDSAGLAAAIATVIDAGWQPD